MQCNSIFFSNPYFSLLLYFWCLACDEKREEEWFSRQQLRINSGQWIVIWTKKNIFLQNLPANIEFRTFFYFYCVLMLALACCWDLDCWLKAVNFSEFAYEGLSSSWWLLWNLKKMWNYVKIVAPFTWENLFKFKGNFMGWRWPVWSLFERQKNTFSLLSTYIQLTLWVLLKYEQVIFFCCSRLDNINIHFTHATHQCVRCTHRELIIDDDKRSTTFENWRKHKTFMFFIENKLEERVQRLQLNFKVHFGFMLSSCFCEALKTQLFSKEIKNEFCAVLPSHFDTK